MKNVKISLINADQAVTAETVLVLNDTLGNTLSQFIQHMNEELATGQTAHLEFEGIKKNPVSFSISQNE
jgi:hypothetical protein